MSATSHDDEDEVTPSAHIPESPSQTDIHTMTADAPADTAIESPSDDVGTADIKAEQVDTADVKAEQVGSEDEESDDVGSEDVGTGDIKAEDVATGDIKAEHVATEDDVDSEDIGTEDVGTADVATEDVGTADVLTEDVGTADVGTEDVGTADVGTADVGTADVGTADVASQEYTEVQAEDVHTEAVTATEDVHTEVETTQAHTEAVTEDMPTGVVPDDMVPGVATEDVASQEYTEVAGTADVDSAFVTADVAEADDNATGDNVPAEVADDKSDGKSDDSDSDAGKSDNEESSAAQKSASDDDRDSVAPAEHDEESSDHESADIPESARRTVIFTNVPDMDEEKFKGRMLKYGDVESLELKGQRAEVLFKNASAAKNVAHDLNGTAFASYPDNILSVKVLKKVLHPGDASEEENQDTAADAGEDNDGGKTVTTRDFKPPAEQVTSWEESMTIEEQLEGYAKMDRCGLLNRYIIIGNAEEEYLSCEALRKELDWIEKTRVTGGPEVTEIVSIELHSLSSNRDVAHITMRDVKGACTLRSYVMENHPTWKIAHCSPRKASKVLWIGGLPPYNDATQQTPWYVEPMERLLTHFGKLKGRIRYMPKARCFFVTYERQADAVRARNTLYTYPLRAEAFGENIYLNVDFAEEDEDDEEELEFVPRSRQEAAERRPVSRSRSARRRNRSASRSVSRRATREAARRAPRRSRSRTPARRRSPVRRPAIRHVARRSPAARRERAAVAPNKRLRSPKKQQGAKLQVAKQQVSKKRRIASGEPKVETKKVKEVKEEPVSPVGPNTDGSTRVKLFKMSEFVCTANSHFIEGNQALRKGLHDGIRLDIDQRTKVENVVSHKNRNEGRWALWKLLPSNAKDKTPCEDLSAYFVARQRVGLVQTKMAHIYIIPPDAKFLDALKLKSDGHALALQIPVREKPTKVAVKK